MKLVCKKCEIERELRFFRRTITNGKSYYTRKECKICLSKTGKIYERRVKKNIKLSKECIVFIDKVKRKAGYIDYIEAYELAHFHVETFGFKETNMDINEDLCLMWNELKELLDPN